MTLPPDTPCIEDILNIISSRLGVRDIAVRVASALFRGAHQTEEAQRPLEETLRTGFLDLVLSHGFRHRWLPGVPWYAAVAREAGGLMRSRPIARGVRESVPDVLSRPPRLVSDQGGNVVEVILDYRNYTRYLRLLAEHADWDALPPYLQDAINNVLAEEAASEVRDSVPLAHILSQSRRPPR